MRRGQGVVRRVRADEWEALRDLRLSALAGAPQAFGTTLASARARTPDDWREAAARGNCTDRWVTFVAEKNGQLVGMVSGTLVDDRGELLEDRAAELIQMWVEPRVRRQGIGKELGEAVLEWAAERGASTIRLQVNESEQGAVALYGGLGFVDTGRREADLFEGRDGIAMVMEAKAWGLQASRRDTQQGGR